MSKHSKHRRRYTLCTAVATLVSVDYGGESRGPLDVPDEDTLQMLDYLQERFPGLLVVSLNDVDHANAFIWIWTREIARRCAYARIQPLEEHVAEQAKHEQLKHDLLRD